MDIEPGELYFVRELDPHTKKFTNFVKIGLVREREGRTSLDRLNEHQTGNPRLLVLPDGNYFKTPAINRVESMMHKVFASQRISGEWFEFASEKEIENAKKKGQALAAEVQSVIPVFEKASKLAIAHDNGKEVAPTDRALELLRMISVSRAKAKVLNELKSEINAKLVVAVERGESVAGVAKERTVNYKPKFDKAAFMAAEPKLYAKYLLSTLKFSATFRLKALKIENAELDKVFLKMVADSKNVIDSVKKNDLTPLNAVILTITTELALVEWDAEFAEAELKLECGKNRGLAGVVTWAREDKETQTFDAAAFESENPKVYSKYLVAAESKTYVQAVKKKLN